MSPRAQYKLVSMRGRNSHFSESRAMTFASMGQSVTVISRRRNPQRYIVSSEPTTTAGNDRGNLGRKYSDLTKRTLKTTTDSYSCRCKGPKTTIAHKIEYTTSMICSSVTVSYVNSTFEKRTHTGRCEQQGEKRCDSSRARDHEGAEIRIILGRQQTTSSQGRDF
jgi:hypothetical protein